MKRYLFLLFLFFLPFVPKAQDAPVSILGSVFSIDSAVTIPVTVLGFDSISSGALVIEYDPDIAVPDSVQTGPDVGGTIAVNCTEPGKIITSWFIWPEISLQDSTLFLLIKFRKISNGTTTLVFNDSGNGCFFAGSDFVNKNDVPFESFYVSGSLTFGPAGADEVRTIDHLLAYPNPCTTDVNLTFSVAETKKISVNVFSVSGKKILERKILCKAGYNQVPLSLGQYGHGIYSVKMVSEDCVSTLKVIVR